MSEATSTTEHFLPRAKLAAIGRFQSIKDGLRPKKKPTIIFPPPSWNITDNDAATPAANSESQEALETQNGERRKELDETEIPEPTTFAEKLKRLIEGLPVPSALAAAVGAGKDPRKTPEPQEDNTIEGPPIPANVDAGTLRLLSSEDVMNGDIDEEQQLEYGANFEESNSGVNIERGKRESIWSALDKLKPGYDASPSSAPPGLDIDQGVMMYAPLEPTNESEVELARFTELPHSPRTEAQDTKLPTPASPPTPAEKVEKVWVPSTTSISVLTTWWGYRLYLPPPVMARLDSNQIKATRRAAMVTTALQWFLTKVPLKVLPGNLRAPVMLLRRLSPFAGYIGVFIAWSWTRIRTYDRGNGVVLSATWLLPVALIPMSWDAGDIYGPPVRPPTPTEEETAEVPANKTVPQQQPQAASKSKSSGNWSWSKKHQ